ncbi:MAG: hypothetical protein DCC48_18010, partial [Acidobacteria bacterium]
LEKLPPVDLVTAGFPCTDLSQAGRTKGITGEASGLFRPAREDPTNARPATPSRAPLVRNSPGPPRRTRPQR